MAVSGYASSTSVVPGADIDFHLSADHAGPADLTVVRAGPTPVSTTFTAALTTQPVPAQNTWEGYGWAASATFTVPDNWPGGFYRLMAGPEEVADFVVRPVTPGSEARVLLHMPFLTWQAYNAAGGKSLYGFNSAPGMDEASRASRVSFDRPGGLFGGAIDDLINWLEGPGGRAVEYCSSIDLHANPGLLSQYDCLILAHHDEYWTKAMRDQAESFVSGGGNLIVLSGNTCYRQVRLEEDNRLVVFYKYAGNDPEPDAQQTTVAFAEPPVNRPQNQLLGVGFTHGAFNGPPSAYTIRFPSHWVFEGVPAATEEPPTTVPFMTYETDAAAFAEEAEGYPRVTGEEGTPLSFVVLASADLRGWTGKVGMATLGLHVRNGMVFTVGTTDWVTKLSDPSIGRITQNVFDRLGQRVAWDWEAVGAAASVRALTSLQDKLLGATSDNKLLSRFPVGAEVPWREIGEAPGVTALAGSGDTLFAVTTTNELVWRSSNETETAWTTIGTGPAAGTRALAAAGGMLYAVDAAGVLHASSAVRAAPNWRPLPTFTAADPTVNAMTSRSDILFASTSDNRLLRSDRDWIWESAGWHQVHQCNFAVGLGAVDGMLFVATTENLLWRLDLHGLRQP